MILIDRWDKRDEQNEPAKNGCSPKEEESLSNRFLTTRSILLCGEIDKELSEKVARHLLLLESAGDQPVKVFIDSPGGDVDAGFAIFDMLRFIKPQVFTIGMGLVASAGALILLAADKTHRLALPNSHYLIHQPLSGIRGVATEIEIHAQELEKTRGKLNRLIAQACSRPLKQVEKDTDRDYWLDADEAVAYGLVSRIVTNQQQI